MANTANDDLENGPRIIPRRLPDQRPDYIERLTCPVCRLLPLGALARNEFPPPCTIRLDDLDPEQVVQFVPRCDLCDLIYDLGNHQASEVQNQKLVYNGVTHAEACGRNELRTRLQDDSYVGLSVDFGRLSDATEA